MSLLILPTAPRNRIIQPAGPSLVALNPKFPTPAQYVCPSIQAGHSLPLDVAFINVKDCWMPSIGSAKNGKAFFTGNGAAFKTNDATDITGGTRSFLYVWTTTTFDNHAMWTGGGPGGLGTNHALWQASNSTSFSTTWDDYTGSSCGWADGTLGKFYSMAIWMDKSLGNVGGYLNGVYSEGTALGTKLSNGASKLGWCVENNGYNGASAYVYMGVIFSSKLTNEQLKALSLNPWQLFKPLPNLRRNIFFNIAAPSFQAAWASRSNIYMGVE